MSALATAGQGAQCCHTPHAVTWIRRWAPLAEPLFLQGSQRSPVYGAPPRVSGNRERPPCPCAQHSLGSILLFMETDLVPQGTSGSGGWDPVPRAGLSSPPPSPQVNPASTGCLGPCGPEVQQLPPPPWVSGCRGGPKRRAGPQEGSHRTERTVALRRWAGNGRGGVGTGPSGGRLSLHRRGLLQRP